MQIHFPSIAFSMRFLFGVNLYQDKTAYITKENIQNNGHSLLINKAKT